MSFTIWIFATTKAGEPELPSTALPNLAWRLLYGLSMNTVTLFASFLFLICTVTAGFALAGKRVFNGDLVLGLALFLIALLAWFGIRVSLLEKPEGVVDHSVAEVRSGPNTT